MNKIKQTTLSKFSNLIFLTIISFLISFVWINYYIRNIRLSLISSIIIALFFFIMYIVFKSYQEKLYCKKNNKNNNILTLRNFLLYSPHINIKNFIFELYNITKYNQTNSPNHFIDTENNCDVFLLFDKEILSEDDYIHIYKTQETSKLKIFCINNPNKYEILENISIEIQTLNCILDKLTENPIQIPSIIQIKKTPKFKLKDILCIILNKSKSKHYLAWGVLLIFFSIFSPFYIYYNIIGSLMLLLSLISRFNKKYN